MPTLSNTRWERFCQEVVRGATQIEAYRLAGYEPIEPNASRLIRNAKVSARIAELKSAAAERVEVDQAYVLGAIKSTVERCRQSEPVTDRKGDPVLCETPNGEIVPAYTFNATAVLKGAELLGKHIGMFAERHELTGKDGGPIEVADLSDEEIARRIAFGLSRGDKSTHALN